MRNCSQISMMMLAFKLFATLLLVGICEGNALPRLIRGIDRDRGEIDHVELIFNGTTYSFTNVQDGGAITVLPDGRVITENYTGKEEQKWTIVEHPRDPMCLEFINFVTPYNDLSGYKDSAENPGVFPRCLTLNKHRIMNPVPELDNRPIQADFDDDDSMPVPWQIVIRWRWCLQSMGLERAIEMDDCDWQLAPWQFWTLKIVELAKGNISA